MPQKLLVAIIIATLLLTPTLGPARSQDYRQPLNGVWQSDAWDGSVLNDAIAGIAFFPDGTIYFAYIEGSSSGTWAPTLTHIGVHLQVCYIGCGDQQTNYRYEVSQNSLTLWWDDSKPHTFHRVRHITEADLNQCPSTPTSHMIVGFKGKVTYTDGTPTRLRKDPGLQGATLVSMDEGFGFTVIGGPTCTDGYTWWQLQLKNGTIGWAAEGNFASYWIEPVPHSETVLPAIGASPIASATPANLPGHPALVGDWVPVDDVNPLGFDNIIFYPDGEVTIITFQPRNEDEPGVWIGTYWVTIGGSQITLNLHPRWPMDYPNVGERVEVYYFKVESSLLILTSARRGIGGGTVTLRRSDVTSPTPEPVTQPTAVPQPTETEVFYQNYDFDDSPPDWSPWELIFPPAYASEVSCPNGVQTHPGFDENQCTAFVAETYPITLCWLKKPAHAYLWPQYVQEKGTTLGFSIASKPQTGDIVVWDRGCRSGNWVADPDSGHVAIVDQVNLDGTINVSERNADGSGNDGQRYNVPVTSCMTFIRPPSTGETAIVQPNVVQAPQPNIIQRFWSTVTNVWNWLWGK